MRRKKQEEAIRVFNLAVDILNNIKDSTIEELYYVENECMCKFTYGSLIISYYNENFPPERVFIEYEGYLVLSYYYDLAKVKYFSPGKWIKLVENLQAEYEDLEYEEDNEDIDKYHPDEIDENREIADKAAEQILKRFRESRY